MSVLTVTYNGAQILEYDRGKTLTEQQSSYLDKMDESMDGGITILARNIDCPDQPQRLEFVAGQLYQAVTNENDAMIAAMCGYIATRQTDAREVRLDDSGGEVSIEILLGEGETQRMSGIPVSLQPKPH